MASSATELTPRAGVIIVPAFRLMIDRTNEHHTPSSLHDGYVCVPYNTPLNVLASASARSTPTDENNGRHHTDARTHARIACVHVYIPYYSRPDYNHQTKLIPRATCVHLSSFDSLTLT